MADRPTSDDILGAIRESGYLMEQEVASELEAMNLHVHTNQAFEDKDEGKSREVDIIAVEQIYEDASRQIKVFLELVCECKNSANPYAFLLRPRTLADKDREVEEIVLPRPVFHVPVLGKPDTSRVVDAIDHLGVRDVRPQSTERLKAVQFAKIVRDNKRWVANHAGLYDAIFYPLAKALRARQERHDARSQWSYVWLYFPLVVTSGELYVIDTTASDLRPVAVDHVSFTRHIKSTRLDGHFTVDFVTRAGLSDFVTNRARGFALNVAAIVKARPDDFVKKD